MWSRHTLSADRAEQRSSYTLRLCVLGTRSPQTVQKYVVVTLHGGTVLDQRIASTLLLTRDVQVQVRAHALQHHHPVALILEAPIASLKCNHKSLRHGCAKGTYE